MEGRRDEPVLHHYPSAVEAIEAVREYLLGEVVPLDGEVGYHARVAAHLLGVVERELGSPRSDEWLQGELGRLGVADEQALATQIRDGDWDARSSELMEVLAAITDERLGVVNPRWLEAVDDDDPRR